MQAKRERSCKNDSTRSHTQTHRHTDTHARTHRHTHTQSVRLKRAHVMQRTASLRSKSIFFFSSAEMTGSFFLVALSTTNFGMGPLTAIGTNVPSSRRAKHILVSGGSCTCVHATRNNWTMRHVCTHKRMQNTNHGS